MLNISKNKLIMAIIIALYQFPVIGAEKPTSPIAVVNLAQLFEEYTKDKADRTTLVEAVNKVKKEITANEKKVAEKKKELISLQSASNMGLLNDTAKQNNRQALTKLMQEVKTLGLAVQKGRSKEQHYLQEEYMKIRTKYLKQLLKVIDSVRTEKGYMLIMDSSGQTLNHLPTAVSFDKSLDITPYVLKRIDEPLH